MNRVLIWRSFSLMGFFVLANMLALTLLFSQPATTCTAQSDVPCGHARIEGRVIADDTKAGLHNAVVHISAQRAASFSTVVNTNADGTYSVDVPVILVGENFVVGATPGISNTRYLKSEAVMPLQLISGTSTIRDFTLPLGGTIRGAVESAETSFPLTDTTVTALRYDASLDRYMTGISLVRVDASGAFTITGLESGSYVLRYQPRGANASYMRLYSGGAYTPEVAEKITVEAPGVIHQDKIAIGIGAVVEGFVRRADNGMPVRGVEVSLRDLKGDILLIDASANSGRYVFTGVPPGQYKVAALPNASSVLTENLDLLGTFYGDTRLFGNAGLVTVTPANLDNPANGIANVDIQLPVGATIQGSVRDAETSAPMADVTVQISQTIYAALTQERFAVSTDANGVFTATALEPTVAQVLFHGPETYLQQAYNMQDFASSPFGGELIELELGKVVTGVQGVLNKASQLSGHVTDPNGLPIGNVYVRLEQVEDPSIVYETFTNEHGEYSRFIAPGQYRVRFSRNVICGCYSLVYYATGNDPSQPTPVSIGAAQQMSEINAILECGSDPSLVPSTPEPETPEPETPEPETPEPEEETIFVPHLKRS